MEVRIIQPSGCLMWGLGILTLGIAPLFIKQQQRSWPAYLDDEGVTTRGGKRIAWSEFTRVVRVVTRLTSGTTIERYELHSPHGKVLVPTERLVNGQEVVRFILEHLPASALKR